jgi:type IV pilus assembly protein PilC
MSRYRYNAIDAEQRYVTAELEADSVAAAIQQVEARGLTIQWIGLAAAFADGDSNRPIERSPQTHSAESEGESSDRLIERHLELTLERTSRVAQPLRALAAELPSRRRRRIVTELCTAMEKGDLLLAKSSFSRSPEYWLPLIGGSAGEHDAAKILENTVTQSQKVDETRRQWWILLAYPLFLLAFATTVLLVLAWFVVPIFRTIFDDFSLQLPWLTRWTLVLSESLASNALLATVAAVLIVVAVVCKLIGPQIVDRAAGWFSRPSAQAILANAMSDLLAGGIPVVDSLRMAASAVKSGTLRDATERLATEIRSNSQSRITSRRPLSNTLVYASTAEMPATARVALLCTLADCYADRARTRLSWSQGWLGPATILVVGFVVALVTLSLFLPLISIVNMLGG